MALYSKCFAQLPLPTGDNSVSPCVYAAIDTEGNIAVALYVPPLLPSGQYDQSYTTASAANQFPGGYKLMRYNQSNIAGLLDSPPPGDDFFMKDLGVF